MKTFLDLDKIVKIILLLIPPINWITELVIRIADVLDKKDAFSLVVAILCWPFGVIVGWVDCFMVICDKPLVLR